MNDNSNYDESYYKSHCGENYERNNGWEEIFARHASFIRKELNPRNVLDVGCAIGYLVEALRDQGTDADGIDISEYAISQVREDMKPFCKVQSITVPLAKKYDLITCIEVLEHLAADEIPVAIENICNSAERVLFSSTPFDYDEETHVSVHNPEFWVEQFAYNGFYHDVKYDGSYISVQAMLFRRADKNQIDLIRDYEVVLFQKHQENVSLRHQLKLSRENVELYRSAYQKHTDMINEELNPQISVLNERLSSIKQEKDAEIEKQAEEYEEKIRKQKTEFESMINHLKTEHEGEMLELKAKLEKRINDQHTQFEKGMNEQKTQFEKGISEQKTQFEKRINEQKKQYEKRISEQQAEYDGIICKRNEDCDKKIRRQRVECDQQIHEMKERMTKCLEKEVKERKYFEDRFYLNKIEHEELKCLRIENLQLKDSYESLRISEQGNKIKFLTFTSIRSLIAEKLHLKRENRYLLSLDEEYWKLVYDPVFYVDNNPDIKHVYGIDEKKILHHFICMGMVEGRRACAGFDVHTYMAYNPDVVKELKYDTRQYYLHYITTGYQEGRRAI